MHTYIHTYIHTYKRSCDLHPRCPFTAGWTGGGGGRQGTKIGQYSSASGGTRTHDPGIMSLRPGTQTTSPHIHTYIHTYIHTHIHTYTHTYIPAAAPTCGAIIWGVGPPTPCTGPVSPKKMAIKHERREGRRKRREGKGGREGMREGGKEGGREGRRRERREGGKEGGREGRGREGGREGRREGGKEGGREGRGREGGREGRREGGNKGGGMRDMGREGRIGLLSPIKAYLLVQRLLPWAHLFQLPCPLLDHHVPYSSDLCCDPGGEIDTEKRNWRERVKGKRTVAC